MLGRFFSAVVMGLVPAVFTVSAWAQNNTTALPVDDELLRGELISEELRESPQVSGVRVLGYSALPVSRDGRPVFRVFVPHAWTGGLACLRVQTSDALYEAAAEIELPADRAGQVVPVFYESGFRDSFWEAHAGEDASDFLAVLLSQGQCASTRPGMAPTLPVLAQSMESGSPVLLVNSFRAEAGFVNVAGSQNTTPCEPIEAPVQTAYDLRCEIDLTPGATGPVTVTIWPIKSGELGLPIEVSVWAFP